MLYKIAYEIIKEAGMDPHNPKALKFGKTLKEKIHKTSTRNTLLKKYGPKAFLMPEQKKFPIVNPNTGKISCKLLKAAKIRAKQHGYEQIAAKADRLMMTHC